MSEDAQNVTTEETPVAEETIVEQPVAEAAPEVVAEEASEPVAEETPAEEPVAVEPAAQAAPADEPVAEEAPVEESPVEEAPVEEATAEESPVEDAPSGDALADDAVADAEPVTDEAPATVSEAFGPVRAARVFVCEKGHRTTTLWGTPTICQAQPLRHGATCGLTLYHITELPEQVLKALNPLKASKKASKKK